jgi:zinc transport system ATP-binding protein
MSAEASGKRQDSSRVPGDGRRGREVAVRFDGVYFSYGKLPVLEGANFHIHEGEFAALLGPNGSGKTTILKLLLGINRPDSGNVRVFGEPPEEGKRRIGYVPQAVVYDPAFPVTVEGVVRMGRLRGSFGRYGREDSEAASRAMKEAKIADLASRPYSALSGGQRRRVLVARALASEPRLLVLDEPTSNMDAESEERLFESLGALKGRTTILIVTHDSGFVSSLTDSVLCVGEERRGTVHRHPAASVEGARRYGGGTLRVLHEADLPDDGCFPADGSCAEEEGV